VVRPGGVVLLRGFLADVPVTGLYRLFPGHERVAATFPATAEVVASFEAAGFSLAGIHDVMEPWRLDLPTWQERIRAVRHTDSALRHYTDDEFEAGVARVIARYAAVPGPVANEFTLRLLVLARPG